MRFFSHRPAPFIIIVLIIAGMLSGCFLDRLKPSGSAGKSQAGALAGMENDPDVQAALAFSNDFTPIKKTSVDEDIEYYLWEAAMAENTHTEAEVAAQALSESLTQLDDKFKQVVASDGVHYVEHNNAMGMDLYTEYWIEDDKFKMLDKVMNKLTLFDGKYYYVINLDDKTAERTDKDDPFVSADVSVKTNGMLSKAAYAGYTQEPDQKLGDFDCSVFYADTEVLGMKGNRLYVDKKTGIVVKNTYGEGDNSMTIEITEFQQGGFGDEVFTVPPGITIQ